MSADTAPQPRRRRGLVENLGAIVLGFESIVVFLGGLAIYGLNVLPAGIPSWWGVVIGSVLAVAMILTAGMLRHRWAIAFGWVLQLLVALGAILVPALLLVALSFGGMWAYATIGGARIEARAARAADPQTPNESD
ncbi:MAG TPA: DUF4233 domain-containing protein [Microbacterium sp.]|nr:DUF4233 domain-containing protein [Microbacterium sp.]